MEDPRRQSTGCCPCDAVAEMEDGLEEVFEGEYEDGAESGREKESNDAVGRLLFCAAGPSSLRFIFMAAPKIICEKLLRIAKRNHGRASHLQLSK
jgi:hypothetical protein